MCMVFSINTYAITTNTSLINSAYLYNDPVAATVTTQNSVCLNSGIATIHATGGTTGTGGTVNYTYEVLTTPAGFTYNASMLNGNVLSGLAIGNYSVRVRDTAGAFIDVTFAISGTPYQNMEPSAESYQICNGVELKIGVREGIGPYQYSIVSGPGITTETPRQNSPIFQIHNTGLYRYRVYDSCNAYQTREHNVTLSTIDPDINWTFMNSKSLVCNNGSYNLNINIGSPYSTIGSSYNFFTYPYQYTINIDNGLHIFSGELTYSNDILSITIPNAIPDHVYNYTITLTNACGKTATFSSNFKYVLNSYYISVYKNCDPYISFNSNYSPDGAYDPINTYELIDINGNVIVTGTSSTFYKYYHPQILFGHQYKIRATTQCRVIETNFITFEGSFSVNEISLTCDYGYKTCDYADFMKNDPYISKLYLASDLNTAIAEKAGSQDNGIYKVTDSNLIIPGNQYVIKIINTDTNEFFQTPTFTWRSLDLNPNLSLYQIYSSWPEGIINTSHVRFQFTISPGVQSSQPLNFKILSGTTNSIIRRDGTVISLNYPIDLGSEDIASLPVGKYMVEVTEIDGCVGTYVKELEVLPSMVQEEAVYEYKSVSIINKCAIPTSEVKISTGKIKPLIHQSIEKYMYNRFFLRNINTDQTFFSSYLGLTINTNKEYTFQNIPNGTYEVGMIYSDMLNAYGKPIRNELVDRDIFEIIVVHGYQQPKIESLIVNPCVDGTRNIVVVPEEEKGIAPYTYSILSGPNGYSAPSQTLPVFLGLQPGVYQFRLEDSCGNAVTEYLDVSNFVPPAFDTVGSSCEGEDVTFSFPNVPYYTYTWLLPNNTTHTGNTLTINNLTASDAGLYTVTITSEVGGCTATVTKQYLLDPCYGLVDPSSKNARVNPNLRQRLRNAN